MLQSIRRGATTLAFKIIIGVFIVALVLLFALGDYIGAFSGRGGQDAVAISAPARDIRESELSSTLLRIATQFQQFYPEGLDSADKLRASNLLDLAQRQLIANQLRAKEVGRLGLEASRSRIEDVIRENEQFFDGDGKFDQRRFDFAVRSAGLTTEGYLQTVAEQIKTRDLARVVALSPEALPQSLTKPIVDYRFTERTFSMVKLPLSRIEAVSLDEPALRQYLADNEDQFQVPELRRVSTLVMSLDALAKPDEISDAEVAGAFEQQREALNVPERRSVQQVVFPTEEAANAAAEKLKDVSVTLGEVADLGGGLVDLGQVTRADLDPVLAEAAFGVGVLEVTEPVKTEFGWHILTTLNRTEGKTATLEEYGPTLRQDLAKQKARDVVERLSEQADQLVGEGASLQEVADSLQLPITSYAAFSTRGTGADGRRVQTLPVGQAFLDEAFKTDAGQTSLLGRLDNDQGFFLLEVEEVLPARVQTFEEAETRVKAIAEREANLARLTAEAERLIAENAGDEPAATLSKIASSLGEPLVETDALNRQTLPRDPSPIRFLRDEAFSLPLGELSVRPAGSEAMIVLPTSELPVTADTIAADSSDSGPKQVGSSFAQAIASELNASLLAALEQDAKIKTNPAAIERVLTSVASQLGGGSN